MFVFVVCDCVLCFMCCVLMIGGGCYFVFCVCHRAVFVLCVVVVLCISI